MRRTDLIETLTVIGALWLTVTLFLVCADNAQAQAARHGTCPGGDGGNVGAWQAPGDTFATCLDLRQTLGNACNLAWQINYDPACFVPVRVRENTGVDLQLNQGGQLGFQVFPDVSPTGVGDCPTCTHGLLVEAEDTNAGDANFPLESTSNFNPQSPAALIVEWKVQAGCPFTWGTRKVLHGTGFQAIRWKAPNPPTATCTDIAESFTQGEAELADVYLWLFDPTDPDGDGDGIPTVTDNCGGTPNPLQVDYDLDGCGNACDGDFDQNGYVDGADYSAFGAWWGSSVPPAPPVYDLNGDGLIGGADMLLFSAQFGWEPGPSGVNPIAFGCVP